MLRGGGICLCVGNGVRGGGDEVGDRGGRGIAYTY